MDKKSFMLLLALLAELPEENIEYVRLNTQVRRAQPSAEKKPSLLDESQNKQGLRLGQAVSHAKFGMGVIIAQEGSGENSRLQVHFKTAGSKWLMTEYANLKAL